MCFVLGLKDLSQINSPPKGRKEVEVYVGHEDKETIRKAILRELERKGQVFVVVPLIEQIEETLSSITEIVPNIRIITAHGRHTDLEERIERFSAGNVSLSHSLYLSFSYYLFYFLQADVLVATTVIENGIDMPNVNTIIILHAHRFGVSALYQLKGRVGRSPLQAYALFMYSKHTKLTEDAKDRLFYMSVRIAVCRHSECKEILFCTCVSRHLHS